MFSLSLLLPFLLSLPVDYVSAKPSHDKVATAWYAGWHSEDFKLSDVSWEKYTRLTYAFAETTPDVNIITLEGSNPELLPEFIKTAKKHGVTPSVSIGGWTGSRFFSPAVATAENRTAFVKTVTKFADKYKLDALDFDWEYPGNQGLGCNVVSPNDTANFLLFLQELRRTETGKRLSLSAATAINPFMGPDGKPSSDVSAFAEVFDHIAVMNYDIWGTWSTAAGPNAPLNDTCAEPANQQGSAVHAIQAWKAAGMPAEKIVLGVPGYGRGFTVYQGNATTDGTTLLPYPAFDGANKKRGDKWDAEPEVDACGVNQTYGGNYNFFGLVEEGFLTEDGEPAPGILSRFDECSQTAYVYSPEKEVLVSYDSPATFTAKGAFIKENGLAGFAMWEAGGDYEDMLLDSIHEGLLRDVTRPAPSEAGNSATVADYSIHPLGWFLLAAVPALVFLPISF